MRKKATSPIKRILVQRADRMGDVILALPVIERLAVLFPAAKIDFLTSGLGAKTVKGHDKISRTIVMGNLMDTVARVRARKYDCYVCLYTTGPLALLGKLAKIPMRIGDKSNVLLAWLFTHKVTVPWADFSRHQVQFNLDFLAPFSVADKPWITQMTPDPDAVATVVKRVPVDASVTTVVIFTDTGGSNLPIPESVLLPFVDRLCADGRYRVVITYGQTAFPELAKRQHERLINLTDFIPLAELVALIAQADYYIGPDTGPTHMAAFLNVPLVYVSARKTNAPTKWGPVGDYFRLVRQVYDCPVFCSKIPCDASRCLSYLNDDVLMDAFDSLREQVAAKQPFSFDQKNREWQKQTWRLLAVFHTTDELNAAAGHLQSLRTDGLMVWSLALDAVPWWRRFGTLLRLVKRYNITVWHGERIPRISYGLIRLLMGVWYLHYKPAWVKMRLNNNWQVADYLACYAKRWREEVW